MTFITLINVIVKTHLNLILFLIYVQIFNK